MRAVWLAAVAVLALSDPGGGRAIASTPTPTSEPTRTTNPPCSVYTHCDPGMICTPVGCRPTGPPTPTSQPTPTHDPPCSADTDCDPGMICTPVGCRPTGPPALGCDTDSDCVPPLRCVGDVCTDVATSTATPSPPFACTLGEDCAGAIEIGSTSGFAGDIVEVIVELHGDDAAYLQADLLYDASLIEVRMIETSGGELRPDCALDPRMEETVHLVVEQPRASPVFSGSTLLSMYVFHLRRPFPSNPFGKGTVLSCAFEIAENAPTDTFVPLNIDRQRSSVSDSQGRRLKTGAVDGGVVILGFGTDQDCEGVNGVRCVEGATCNSNFFESCLGFENECRRYLYRCTCFDEIWTCRSFDPFGCSRVCVAPVGSPTATPDVYCTPEVEPTPTGAIPGATPTLAAACAGDCDRDGFVRVHELVKAVRISLGLLAVESCAAADPAGDRTVSIADLMSAVNAATDSPCR